MTDSNQTYHGEYFTIYINIRSLLCIPETNRVLYMNYISINKYKIIKYLKTYKITKKA